MKKTIQIVTLLFLTWSCTNSKNEPLYTKYAVDNHSFAKPNEAVAKHLDLDIKVDFNQKKNCW